MNIIPCEKLMRMGAREVKDVLASGRTSVLESLGAHRLRLEMMVVGWLCRAVVFLIFLGRRQTWRRKRRARLIVRGFFLMKIRKIAYRAGGANAVVVYFNHQSLFEVLAAIWYCLKYFPDKDYLFPVNLPWYEALTPVFGKLQKLGILITPMITPSTKDKLESIVGDDPIRLDTISALKLQFENEFGSLVVEFLAAGKIVAVAPSATRTKYVFPSYAAFLGVDRVAIKKMQRSMSAICMNLKRRRLEGLKVDFVPLVATRRRRAGRGLNIWRWHSVYVGAAESLEVMLAKLDGRTLDYDCYRRLAEFVSEEFEYDPYG